MDLSAVTQSVANLAYTVLLACIPVVIAAYGPRLVRWADTKIEKAKASLTREQMYAAESAARLAVGAVEQLRKNGAILDNKHALDAATAYTEQWLKSRGIVLDITELRTVIESSVNDLGHKKPPVKPGPIAGLPAGDKWE